MQSTWVNESLGDIQSLKEFHRSYSILNATELICSAMKEAGVKRIELADRLGTSKAYVTNLLNGQTNMTLGTLSDILVVLGYALDLDRQPLSWGKERSECPHGEMTLEWEQRQEWGNVSIQTELPHTNSSAVFHGELGL